MNRATWRSFLAFLFITTLAVEVAHLQGRVDELARHVAELESMN
jgi:hypothetical protein